MLHRLPPTISHLIFFFLLASPLLAAASPIQDDALALDTTPDAPVVAVAAAAAEKKPPTKVQTAAKRAPTRRMGQRKAKKSEVLKKKDYSSFLCPGGSVACPVYTGEEVTSESAATLESSLSSLADWFKIGFECMELDSELNSCGGCLALGAGQDCSEIANARATGCESGTCAVYSCFDGYVVSPDRLSCVKKGTVQPATPVTAVTMDVDQLVMR